MFLFYIFSREGGSKAGLADFCAVITVIIEKSQPLLKELQFYQLEDSCKKLWLKYCKDESAVDASK